MQAKMRIETNEGTKDGFWNMKFYGPEDDNKSYFFIDGKKIEVKDVSKIQFCNNDDEIDYYNDTIYYLPAVFNYETFNYGMM